MGEIMKKTLIVLLVLFGVFLATGCVEDKSVTPAEEEAAETPTVTETQNVTGSTGLKEFTLEELAEYNGNNEDGTIYVAYQSQVYDVSSDSKLWRNGDHEGCPAGIDVTGMIENTPHGAEIMNKYPVVGTLKE
ncbi:MAG: cytochrome b5 domain-containing protein [Methanosarcina sp.]|nr:cytochrome b5 domain-containing protein [Methanosarcina sp.]